MWPTRASLIVLACSTAVVAARQTPTEIPRFRVAVEIVSIDAVVTDHKGEVVSNLTAADFEVLQDGKRQKIAFAEFVPVATATAKAATTRDSTAAPARSGLERPPLRASPITREDAQRAFLIVVDDLGLSVQGMADTKTALRRFVDTELQPTDRVSIVRTAEVGGTLQSLTDDRGTLQAAIEALRYNTHSRKGVSPTSDVIQVGGNAPEFDEVGGLQRSVSVAGSLAALNLIVQAAHDLPGRKTVIFASEGFPMITGTDASAIPETNVRVREAVDRVIDRATRSGVVIYAVDGQALQSGALRASDDIHMATESNDPRAASGPDAMSGMARALAADRVRSVRDAQESLAYLAEQTGGFAVVNTNDLAGGLRRISNDVRGYYVIGYEPDRDTFATRGKPPRVHQITVSVKRADVHVRTHKEFIGVSDPARPSGLSTPAQQLVRAAMSPFSTTAIPVHATNLPGYAAGSGLFVRTALHLDAQALTLSSPDHGARTATVDFVGLVYDGAGAEVGSIAAGFNITLPEGAAEQALRNGVVFTARVRIEKPGGYQLRYAVRDRGSGAIGSVGGFVNVPDVTGGAFALSGLVVRAGEPSAGSESIDSERFSLQPADVLRVYAAGTQLSYSYEIYNAGTTVQATTSLWRGTDRVTALPPETLMRPTAGDTFLANGTLTLGSDLAAGTYVLQIDATSDDPKHPKKPRGTIQQLSFDVR